MCAMALMLWSKQLSQRESLSISQPLRATRSPTVNPERPGEIGVIILCASVLNSVPKMISNVSFFGETGFGGRNNILLTVVVGTQSSTSAGHPRRWEDVFALDWMLYKHIFSSPVASVN